MAWNEAINQSRTERLNLERLKVLEALLRYFERRASDRKMSLFTDKTAMDGVKSLKRHVEQGGDLRSSLIDLKDAEMFKELLRYHHVSYSYSEMITKDGETKAVFTTKDTDSDLVQKAVGELAAEVGTGLSQLPAEEFLKRAKDTDIYTLNDLTEVEVAVFQSELSAYNAVYAINRISDDKYELLYMPKDAPIMKEVAMRVAYDLSGDNGEEYGRRLKAELEKEHAFQNEIKNALKVRIDEYNRSREKHEDMPVVYIVDTYNPGRFIAVTEKGFSIHDLHDREEVDETGAIEHHIDDISSVHGPDDHGVLMKYVNQLNDPVIINRLDDFGIIGGFSNHKVSLHDSDTTRDRIMALRERIKDRKDAYQREKTNIKLRTDCRIHILYSIPDEAAETVRDMIESGALCHTVIAGNDIAYVSSDEKILDGILDRMLYKDVADKLEYCEKRLMYNGAGEVNLHSGADGAFYLIDFNNRQFAIRIDEEGLTVFMNDEKVSEISRLDNGFENIVSTISEQIEYPVVLSEQEYSSNERDDYISLQAPQLRERDMRELIVDTFDRECLQLIGTLTGSVIDNPTERQEVSLQKNNSWQNGSRRVDEAYIAKALGVRTDERLRDSGRYQARRDYDSVQGMDYSLEIGH